MRSTATNSKVGPRFFTAIADRPGLVTGLVLAITALLVIPFLTLAPTESASTEPGGDVFTARDRIDETFVSSVHSPFFIVEHDDGDLLRAAPLAELLATHDELRADPTLGANLFSYFDVEAGVPAEGILTLPELVDLELRTAGGPGLARATDAQVKEAGAAVIERLGERSSLLGLSPQSTVDADGSWTIPAISYPVLSDNTLLGFGNTSVNLGGDTDVEEYDRDLQEVLRRADGFQVNGVAIDVNLTSQEQGAVAGPFIGFTILAVLLLVGLTFRSYWVLATVSVSFVLLIIWLKGISNLIGLEDDLVLSLIVPVAMISFGVDFAFHAIGRYREERAEGLDPRRGFIAGMSAVSGALVLALTSDTSAFLANLTSGIESIDQFGIGAAIALGSAFLLLGIVTPLVVAHIEATVPAPRAGRRSSARRVAGALGAASLTMATVLLLVFILPWLGVVLAGLTLLVTLVIPYVVMSRRRGDAAPAAVGGTDDSRLAEPVGRTIAAIARRPLVVLPAALAVTAAAAVLAVQVPAAFDVEDFFSPDTDFVVGLDQLDDHVGDRGGEPAQLYIEGDMADPARLSELEAEIETIRTLDSDTFAKDDDGIRVEDGITSVLDAAFDSPVMAGLVFDTTGVELTDGNGDRIPDTRDQIVAVLSVASQAGVPLDAERLLLTPDDVNTAVSVGDDGSGATVFSLQLVDSRAQESVASAKDTLEPTADRISAIFDGSFVEVTGSPFVREASLDATNRALQVSLPVALLLCLTVATVFLRSIRYGLASVAPIVMVVAWLYAFMELAGYSINLVTATIAAVSIGIGIDFAIHFIARYREELDRTGRRPEAVRIAGEGTGLALVASSISSAIGFGILALAPMPLFAAYGLLTALMIVMALVATLAVLPSILVLITTDRVGDQLDSGGPASDGRFELRARGHADKIGEPVAV